MPRIQDNLDSLSGSEFFTTLDLFSGYFQTFIEPASIPKTAFTTANGHFEFLHTPFGLRNALSQFSRLMQIIFVSIVLLPYISTILRYIRHRLINMSVT